MTKIVVGMSMSLDGIAGPEVPESAGRDWRSFEVDADGMAVFSVIGTAREDTISHKLFLRHGYALDSVEFQCVKQSRSSPHSIRRNTPQIGRSQAWGTDM